MTTYQEELKKLLMVCERYRNNQIETEELKKLVWETARTITDTEERDLRDFLQHAEGELDMIQFTCEDVFGESLRIVSGITEKITSAIKGEDSDKEKEDISVKTGYGEIRVWIEPDAGFFIRTLTESGDSVRLSGEEARRLANALAAMADKADKICGSVQAAV